MRKYTSLFLLFLLVTSKIVFAQYNNIEFEIKPEQLHIVQIDYTEVSTLVFLKYTNKGSGWIYISDKTHLKDTKSNKVYYLLNSINISLSDEGEPRQL